MIEFKDRSDDEVSYKEATEFYKLQAKFIIERMELKNQADPDSADYRIHSDILYQELIPQFEELGSMFYTLVTAKEYLRTHPQDAHPTYEEVLEIEEAINEVHTMLTKAGIGVLFNQRKREKIITHKETGKTFTIYEKLDEQDALNFFRRFNDHDRLLTAFNTAKDLGERKKAESELEIAQQDFIRLGKLTFRRCLHMSEEDIQELSWREASDILLGVIEYSLGSLPNHDE